MYFGGEKLSLQLKRKLQKDNAIGWERERREEGAGWDFRPKQKVLCETTLDNGSFAIKVLNGVVHKSLSIDRSQEERGESHFVGVGVHA